MQLHHTLFSALNCIYRNIPPTTPGREEHIYNMMSSVLNEITMDTQKRNMVVIDVGDDYAISQFALSTDLVRRLCNVFPMDSFQPSSPLGVVLLPCQMICCEKTIRMDSRHATMTLFDVGGPLSCMRYHGKCRKCGSTFYHGYSEDKKKEVRTYAGPTSPFLLVTSCIGFSKEFLRRLTDEIFIGVVSFESAAGEFSCSILDYFSTMALKKWAKSI